MRNLNLTTKPRRGHGGPARATPAPTLTPGTLNSNQQRVVGRTGAPSRVRRGQAIYRLHCEPCGFEFGCNGLDVKSRCCPACGGGAPGEPLPAERAPGLFDASHDVEASF